MRLKSIGKKGSYTVFLVMFMSGMIFFSSAVINAAHTVWVDSTAEDLGNVWASSILSEYDRVLLRRYGLMGYYGNENLVREKLIHYSDYSFKGKKYFKRGEITCHMEEFKMDTDTVRDQIIHSEATFWKPVPFEGREPETPDGENDTGKGRFISAKWIINSLPSRSLKGQKGKGGAVGSICEMTYIFKAFKDHVDERDLGKTYFRNEIEYIIAGKLNDEKSRKAVYDRMLIERNGMNLLYLYSSAEKRTAALEAAELLTPGPEAVITQALILETWAFLESRNDMALLYAGERVPIMKGDDNWALGLEAAVDSEFSEDGKGELDTKNSGEKEKYVRPKRIEGQKYEDYLKTLLLTVPENKKLLRIMDLIQINMKYAYCDYFLLEDYYTGISFEMTVNDRIHEFERKYR